jgi:hypothetical protein
MPQRAPRKLKTYECQARITRNAPVIMKGPKGICCFLVARPEIASPLSPLRHPSRHRAGDQARSRLDADPAARQRPARHHRFPLVELTPASTVAHHATQDPEASA